MGNIVWHAIKFPDGEDRLWTWALTKAYGIVTDPVSIGGRPIARAATPEARGLSSSQRGARFRFAGELRGIAEPDTARPV
jgi:hypothetical protein